MVNICIFTDLSSIVPVRYAGDDMQSWEFWLGLHWAIDEDSSISFLQKTLGSCYAYLTETCRDRASGVVKRWTRAVGLDRSIGLKGCFPQLWPTRVQYEHSA